MRTIRILLLSDIHYLTLAKERDVNYELRREFLRDIKGYADAKGKIDHILVSGDIAFKGSNEEYGAALPFFEEVCNASGCPKEEIYTVPGNHDKNFYAERAELRHILHAGLSNPDIDTDKLCEQLLNKDAVATTLLYSPFREYCKFAIKLDSCDPMMANCLDDSPSTYNSDSHSMYFKKDIDRICDYKVTLYGLNSALISDWYDINDNGNGHKVFLPDLSFNAVRERFGSINIMMMHHPTSLLLNGQDIEHKLDEKFPVQIFGHMHKPSSDNGNAIHIHSGAFQPPQEDTSGSEDYFSVFNILEITLEPQTTTRKDNLKVTLLVEKYNSKKKGFEHIEKESKVYMKELEKAENRWALPNSVLKNEEPTELPEGVSLRKIRVAFLQSPKPQFYIRKFSQYDTNKSMSENCADFLNKMESENRLLELWNELNKN